MIHSLEGHSIAVTSVAISQDASFIKTYDYGGNKKYWNVKTGLEVKDENVEMSFGESISSTSEGFVSLDSNSVSFTLDFASDNLIRCGSLVCGCFEKSYLCWDVFDE